MFFDERIEQERGKITRNTMLLATICALICGILRALNVALNMDHIHSYSKLYYFLPLGFEAIITITGALIFLVGFILARTVPSDEYGKSQCSTYYSRAGRWQLCIALTAFALFEPLSLLLTTHVNFQAIGTEHVALHLFLLISAYLTFSFKRRDIYFNYSILEAPQYKKAVLKNLGKLAFGSLVGLGVSLFATACGGWLLHTSRTVGVMLICLILWSVLLILFSLTYALLSLLEYLSFYKKQLISGAPLLTLYFVLFCRGSYTVISALIVKSNQTMVTQLMTLNYFAFLPLCAGFWLVLFLLYYHHEYYTATKDRLFHVGMLLMLVAEALGSFSDFVLTLIQTTLLPRLLSDISLHLLFADLNLWQLLLTYLTFLVGFVLAIAGPVRHTRAKKGYLWGAAMLFALTLTLEFLFHTQYYGTWQYLISSLAWLLLYAYLFCFLLQLLRQPTIAHN